MTITHTNNLPVSIWPRWYHGKTNFGRLNVRSKSKSLVRDAYDSNFERDQSLRLSQQRAEKAENEVARLKAELEALKKKWKWSDDRIKGLDLILFIDIFSKCRRIGEFISIPNDNTCLAQLSSMICMTIMPNYNRLKHFIDLQDD